MAKAKVCIIVLLLLCVHPMSVFATPRDVQYHWSGTAVNTLMENGIMKGYDDGRFKPSKYITREEACVLLVSFAKYQGLISEEELYVDDAVDIADTSSSWATSEVQYMYRNGIMESYADGFFRPHTYLTRESLACLLYNYYEKFQLFGTKGIEETECPFTDIENSSAKEQIVRLYQEGILKGYEDNTFKPTDNLTRAEVATILFQISECEPIPPEITLPTYRVINVPYTSQVYPVSALVGCEGTSLLMGLHAKGYSLNVDLRQFLDAMPKTESNPEKGFAGSPYVVDRTKTTRTTIYPRILAAWASNYGKLEDFSGSSNEEIRAELLDGNPVVIYATLWWEKPFYRTYNIEGTYQSLLSNNHVVLACGYDMNTNMYYISDPYNVANINNEYKYWIDGYTFEHIYNVRKQAVVVQ